MPQFDCTKGEEHIENCSRQQICQEQYNYTVNYSNSTSLDNWVGQLGLVCKSGEEIGLLSSMFFVGWACTTLILPPMADKYGRKWIFRISILITVTAMFFMQFSKSLQTTYFLMFTCGAVTAGKISVGFVYGSEFYPEKFRSLFGTVFLGVDAFTVCLSAFFFGNLSRNANQFLAFGVFWGIVGLVIHWQYVCESPLWQLKVGRVESAKSSLRKILLFNNGVQSIQGLEMLQKPPEDELPKESIRFFLKQKTIITNLLVMTYMWASCSFTYYMIAIYVKYIPGSIYLNMFGSGIAEVLANVVAGIMFTKFGIKKSFAILFALSIFGATCILL